MLQQRRPIAVAGEGLDKGAKPGLVGPPPQARRVGTEKRARPPRPSQCDSPALARRSPLRRPSWADLISPTSGPIVIDRHHNVYTNSRKTGINKSSYLYI